MKSRSSFKEEEQVMSKGKLPLSYAPSSSCHKKGRLCPVQQMYEKNEIGCLLGNKFEGEEDNEIGEAKMDDEEAPKQQGEGEDESVGVVIDKEHMFDKVVTPSDVGKLNRLVIPKQHAEKYFPLDSSTNEKGLLLNFEDRNGKEWRFRYSYWNSSQSYVMTKGWSRFVKEKKLDAGDIVSFQRGVGVERLYIDWRPRPDALDHTTSHHHSHHHHHFSSSPWSPLLMRPPATSVPLLLSRDHLPSSNPNSTNTFSFATNYNNVVNPSSVFYVRSLVPQHQHVGMGMVQWQQGGGEPAPTMVYHSAPVVQGRAAAKRLRLFGVNMDCPIAASDRCLHNQPHNFSSITNSIPLPHFSLSLQPSQVLQHSQLPQQFRLYNIGSPLQVMPSPQYLHNDKSSTSLDLEI